MENEQQEGGTVRNSQAKSISGALLSPTYKWWSALCQSLSSVSYAPFNVKPPAMHSITSPFDRCRNGKGGDWILMKTRCVIALLPYTNKKHTVWVKVARGICWEKGSDSGLRESAESQTPFQGSKGQQGTSAFGPCRFRSFFFVGSTSTSQACIFGILDSWTLGTWIWISIKSGCPRFAPSKMDGSYSSYLSGVKSVVKPLAQKSEDFLAKISGLAIPTGFLAPVKSSPNFHGQLLGFGVGNAQQKPWWTLVNSLPGLVN